MLLEPLGSDPLACAGQERRGEASEQGWLGCAAGSRAKKEHAQAARQGKVLAGGHPLDKWAALTAPHSHLQLCLHQQLCLLQHLLHRRKHDCALQLQGLLGMCSGAERGAWGVGDSACHPATKAHEALKGARLRVGGFRREALCRNVRSYMHEGATTRLTSSPSCQVRPAQPATPPSHMPAHLHCLCEDAALGHLCHLLGVQGRTPLPHTGLQQLNLRSRCGARVRAVPSLQAGDGANRTHTHPGR